MAYIGTESSPKEYNKEEGEIDLLLILKTIWDGRLIIIKTIITFIIIGLIIALLSAREYTATTIMVPQTGDNKSQLSGLSSIAALAGFNMNLVTTGELSPRIYPQIVQSIPFKKELLYSQVYLKKAEGNISVYDFYDSIYKNKLINKIKKYTIGLPGIILMAIFGTEDELPVQNAELIIISRKEMEGLEFISELIAIEVNEDEGYITLSASMPEALAAAQLTKKVQELLQNYITVFKIRKAQEQLQFIEERYKEKKNEFETAQENLASFRDRNKNVSTSMARTEEERLQSEYQLAYNVYSELAKQLESAKIKVKEDTPVFTIIEPVSIPVEKSKPKRAIILILWTIAGVFTGTMIVLSKMVVQHLSVQWKKAY